MRTPITLSTIVPAAATDDFADVPRLIGPSIVEASGPAALPVAQPLAEPQPVAESSSVVKPTAQFVEAELAVTAAEAAMRRQLDEVLAPQSAEFPVVASAVEGLHFGQFAAAWYGAAALIGLLAAVLVEAFARDSRASTAGAANDVVEGTANEKGTASATSEAPPSRIIQTGDDAAMAVKAPLVAVVRRRVA
ncbi:MAG: hypothetical protein QM775_22120 [Pirellulales bacterium]